MTDTSKTIASAALENLFEKFKDFDKYFTIVPGVDGHILFVPRRMPAFLVGKALQKVDSDTEFTPALIKSLTDYKIIWEYLRDAQGRERLTRAVEIAKDIAICNHIALRDDTGAGLAGAWSSIRLDQLAKIIAEQKALTNAAMRGENLQSALDFVQQTRSKQNLERRQMVLRLRGPKGLGRNFPLPNKPRQPEAKPGEFGLFGPHCPTNKPPKGGAMVIENDPVSTFMAPFILGEEETNLGNCTLTSVTRIPPGGAVLVNDTELSTSKKFWKLIVEHRKKIVYILISGALVYICFKNRKFIRKFYKKVREISNHWIFQNRITKTFFILCRYSKPVPAI